jgi:hypothetical protein
VNGPHFVRWQPSASVRSDSAQPPTFYILPTHPSSLFFTTHNLQNSLPSTPRAHCLSQLSATSLNQHNDNLHNTQEHPLIMTVRSPVGALPRYLPNGFSLICLFVCFFCLQLQYDSMCCDSHVFHSVNISYFCRHFSSQGYTGPSWIPQEPHHGRAC